MAHGGKSFMNYKCYKIPEKGFGNHLILIARRYRT